MSSSRRFIAPVSSPASPSIMTEGSSVREKVAASWRDVTVRYPYAKRDAVGPVSFDLKRGERLLLLGSSGSGKSTLLNTLNGLVPQTIPAERKGDVRLGEEDVGARPPAGWAAEIARFFQ